MFKIALIFLIITLIISILSVSSRSKRIYGNPEKHDDESKGSRHISKNTGEYVDFEDLRENDNQ